MLDYTFGYVPLQPSLKVDWTRYDMHERWFNFTIDYRSVHDVLTGVI